MPGKDQLEQFSNYASSLKKEEKAAWCSLVAGTLVISGNCFQALEYILETIDWHSLTFKT